MRTLTLTQPWASLVAFDAKRVETRSWRTNYRGPIAIHAAKGFPNDAVDLCMRQPFNRCLQESRIHRFRDLPLGAIVAIAKLSDVWRVERQGDAGRWGLSVQEQAFGDYGPGRYAWFLRDIELLPVPIAAKGALGLWEWVPPWTLSKKDA